MKLKLKRASLFPVFSKLGVSIVGENPRWISLAVLLSECMLINHVVIEEKIRGMSARIESESIELPLEEKTKKQNWI